MDNDYIVFKKENELKSIKIQEDIGFKTGLYKYKLHINIDKKLKKNKDLLNKEYEYTIEIKCKGYKKYKIFIEKDCFEKIFNGIFNLDFKKLYDESDFGDDGSVFILEITKDFFQNKYIKNIELWSPEFNKKNNEINKLGNIIYEIKSIISYEEYCNIIKKDTKEIIESKKNAKPAHNTQ